MKVGIFSKRFCLWRWMYHCTTYDLKHCQRHNGPEGWVLVTKVTYLGHITNYHTNLGQTSSESRPSTNYKISTKHQQNFNLKILTKPSFRIRPSYQSFFCTSETVTFDCQNKNMHFSLETQIFFLTIYFFVYKATRQKLQKLQKRLGNLSKTT